MRNPDVSALRSRAAMMLMEVLESAADYRLCGTDYRIRCPADGGAHFNVSVWAQNNEAPLKCWSHGCDPSDYRCPRGSPQARRARQPDGSPKPPRALDDAKRTEYALQFWREARPAVGTLVETYLRSRHITIPVPQSLRIHPKLRHPSDVNLPAMIAAVQSIDRGIVAIHRTYLRPDGADKANVEKQKMILGPCVGLRSEIRENEGDCRNRRGYRDRP
jgi:hypothetical protein